MRIFADTNIIMEYLAERAEYYEVKAIISYCKDHNWNLYISVGSFYTITFLLERVLHQKGITRPELVEVERKTLRDLLNSVTVVEATSKMLKAGLDNMTFTDLEDSYQYECAVAADCDVILTINIKDFKLNTANHIKILNPKSFLASIYN